ncbi:MAG: MEDS domain-containing protein [Methyloceanibacter sp.]|uniref:MEDS domain-containing protein n=1 Tax=Methyloceanibacter sp. TaxID=1965321 RepID=UPI003D6C90E1
MARRRRSAIAATSTVHLAGSALVCPCHVCAFYSSAEEQYAALVPFLSEGLEAGERVVSLVDANERADRIKRLKLAGVNVEAAQRSGQLEIEIWENTYLRDGRFDAEEMLVYLQEAINTGLQRGFARTRGWANMEWALTGAPGAEELALYESRANFILPLYSDAAVCAYDVSRFPASVLEDVARAHPYILADGFVQENPHYVPPEELVPEFERRRH